MGLDVSPDRHRLARLDPDDVRLRRRRFVAIAIHIGRLRRDRGISVARPTPLGSPHPKANEADRLPSIERYRAELPRILERSPAARAQFDRIVAAARAGDVTLLCWCAPKPCHAEAIADAVRDVLATQTPSTGA